MTTTLLGNDYLAWIETAVAGTYAAILGQGTLSETRSQTNIDTSDKTSNGYMTEAYGNIKVSYSLDIIAKLPDAAYTRMETMIGGRAPFMFQVRKNGQVGVAADAIFTAQMYGTIASRTFTKDGTVDVKISLSLAQSPTNDALA